MVQVHRVTLLIVDHDEVGAAAVAQHLQYTRYPNHCIAPTVLAIETREVEWSDNHPLNQKRTQAAEAERLFAEPKLTCFTSAACRTAAGHASCVECDFPRAYVNPGSYSGCAELGDVLVDGEPMRTIYDVGEPLGVVTVVARRAPGPITTDNLMRSVYKLPGYGQSVVTTSPVAEQEPQEQRSTADQQGGPEDPHRGA
jgi:hypothetical protein